MTERGLKNINVFYSTFTNVFLLLSRFLTFFNFFLERFFLHLWWPWERTGRGKLLLRCVCSAAREALGRLRGGEGQGHIVSPRDSLLVWHLFLRFFYFIVWFCLTFNCIRKHEANRLERRSAGPPKEVMILHFYLFVGSVCQQEVSDVDEFRRIFVGSGGWLDFRGAADHDA